jgi:CubicO group peptidase (beta-lactamase class C family)
VARSTKRHVHSDGGFSGRNVGYGYLWWIFEPDPDGKTGEDVYAALGWRGQYVFVIPEHDMVVVVTGGTGSYEEEQRPIAFLYSHVLPAVRLPPGDEGGARQSRGGPRQGKTPSKASANHTVPTLAENGNVER